MKAVSAAQLADKNFQRATDLYAHHAIAEKDLQQAESDHAAAQADLQSTQDALRALGSRDLDAMPKILKTTSEIPVLAPASGMIVERL